MNIQVFGTKKSSDTRKVERFFKERRHFFGRLHHVLLGACKKQKGCAVRSRGSFALLTSRSFMFPVRSIFHKYSTSIKMEEDMEELYDPVQVDPEAYINHFVMVPSYWEDFKVSDLLVDISQWACIKMFNESCDDLNEQITSIPTQYGGIYIYVIKPPVIPSCGEYIMYVGKATKTPNENLRNRVRSYKIELGPEYKRDKIHRIFKKWGRYIYVRYLPIPKCATTITDLEDRLIAALTPPCNSQIRNPRVKHAVKAFNYV